MERDPKFWIVTAIIGFLILSSGLSILQKGSKSIYTVDKNINPRSKAIVHSTDVEVVDYRNLSETQQSEFNRMLDGNKLNETNLNKLQGSYEMVEYKNTTYVVRSSPLRPESSMLYRTGAIISLIGFITFCGSIWKYRMSRLRARIEELEEDLMD